MHRDEAVKWQTYHDIETTPYASVFRGLKSPILFKSRLLDFMSSLSRSVQGDVSSRADVDGDVVIEAGAVVASGAVIIGPAWICSGAEIRPNSFIRDACIIGPGARIGHASEIVRSVVGPQTRALHYDFVGDCFIGSNVHIGASCVFSNTFMSGPATELAKEELAIRLSNGDEFMTGTTKFGAIVGDEAQIASNLHIAPTTLIGRRSVLLPRLQVRGVIPKDTKMA